LVDNVIVFDNGLIYHPIERRVFDKYNCKSLKGRLKRLIIKIVDNFPARKLKKKLKELNAHKTMISKSIGYHQFNMYAFAILKEQMPGHPFWKSDLIKSMVGYMVTDEYKDGIENNQYGFPYNPPGFEVPFSLCILGELEKEEMEQHIEYWVNKQLDKCYNPKTGLMDRNTKDPITLTARLYEAVRLMQIREAF